MASCPYCGEDLISNLDIHITYNHTNAWSGRIEVKEHEANGLNFESYGYVRRKDDRKIFIGSLDEDEEDE